MFKNELLKAANKRLITLIAIIIIANIIVTYISFQKKPADASEVNEYIELYKNNYAEFDNRYINFIESSNDVIVENIGSLSKEAYSLKTVKELNDYINRYNNNIDSILFQADVNISESLPKTYSYKYQVQVKNMYESLSQKSLPMTYVSGWDSYLLNNQQCLFILIAVIVLSSFIVINDYDVGMNRLIQTTIKGKVKVATSKILVNILMIAIITLVVSGTTIVSIIFAGGLSGENAPIQLLPLFEVCPYNISILQYAFIQLVVRIIGFVSVGIFTMLISKVFKSYIVSTISAISILTLNNLIVNPQLSSKSFTVLFNQWLLIDVNTLFGKYQSFKAFNYSIYVFPTILLSFLVIIALSSVFIIYYKGRVLNNRKKAFANNTIQSIQRNISAKSNFRYPFQFELKKMFSNSIAIILCIFLLILKGYLINYSIPEKNDNAYQMYTEIFRGEMTPEKETRITDIRNEIDDTLASKQSMVNKYKGGEITDTEYREYMKQYWENYVLGEEFGKIEKYSSFLKESEFSGWIIYDTGYNIFFNLKPDIILCALLFIILYGVFHNEKKIRMDQLNNTTVKGTEYLYKKKIQSVMIITIITSTLFILIDMATVISKYTFPTLEAPIQSLRMFGDVQVSLKIWQFLILFILLKVIYYIGFSLLVALIGLKAKNNITIVVFALLAILIPHILSNYIPLFEYLDILNYFSVTPIIENTGWNIALFIGIPCISLLVMFLAIRWGKKHILQWRNRK